MVISLRYTVILLLGSIGRVYMKESQVCYHNLIDSRDDSCKTGKIAIIFNNQSPICCHQGYPPNKTLTSHLNPLYHINYNAGVPLICFQLW